VLIENPNALTKMNVPTSETGIGIAGMIARASPEEHEDDRDDDRDRRGERDQHALIDRGPRSSVEPDLAVEAGWNDFARSAAARTRRWMSSASARAAENVDADRVLLVELRIAL
jgi:hypothetical protein